MKASADKLTPIAKIAKSSGAKGEIVVRFHSDYRDQIDLKRPVFIKYDGLPVPFFIESFDLKGANQAIVSLRWIDSGELSDEIVGEFIFVDYIKSPKEEFTPKELIGFEVVDTKGGSVGTVTSFYDYAMNPCIGISSESTNNQEILLPLHKDIITKSDLKKRRITVNIPEGLLELYIKE